MLQCHRVYPRLLRDTKFSFLKEFSVNGAMLVSSDHQAGNGVIHIIDRVLFPPETTAIGKIREEPSLRYIRIVEQWSVNS